MSADSIILSHAPAIAGLSFRPMLSQIVRCGCNAVTCGKLDRKTFRAQQSEIAKLLKAPKDILQDYPEDTRYVQYGSTPNDAWGQVQDEVERRGLIRRCRIGRAECMLFKARAVVAIYKEALRTDPFGLFGVEKSELSNRSSISQEANIEGRACH